MERRQFLNLGLTLSAGALVSKALKLDNALAAPAAKAGAKAAGPTITDKDIVKETMTGLPVTNFCHKPEKKNPKCPGWTEGHCVDCTFYNKESETTFKGTKYAKCQLFESQTAKYVASSDYCATFVKRS